MLFRSLNFKAYDNVCAEHPKDRRPLMCVDEEWLIVSGHPSFFCFPFRLTATVSAWTPVIGAPRTFSLCDGCVLVPLRIDLLTSMQLLCCLWWGGGLSGLGCCGWDTAENWPDTQDVGWRQRLSVQQESGVLGPHTWPSGCGFSGVCF